MGLQAGLFAGVAGLDANGSAISIIADNIANTNTIGFKSSRAEFVDVLSGSLNGSGTGNIGAGSLLSGVAQNFTQGSLESTGVTTDLAVDGGGFFVVQDSTGIFYTRSGIFRLDENKILVNAQGQAVQGFGITPAGTATGAIGIIDLSATNAVPTPTTLVNVNVNLDPNDPVPTHGLVGPPALTGSGSAAAGFDHTDPVSTSNFQTGIRMFDSLGNARTALVYFRKDTTTNNQWFWYAGVNRKDVDFASYGVPFSQFTTLAAGDPNENQFIPLQSGRLTFTTSGALSAESTTALAIRYDFNGDGVLDDTNDGEDTNADTVPDDFNPIATPANATGWAFTGGSAPGQNLVFDFGTPPNGINQTTQFGGSTTSGVNNFVRLISQNGVAAGSLSSLSIDENGFMTGSFSNGQTQRLAQIALASFANVNGLQRVGKNNYIESNSSGSPIVGTPNQAQFGAIRSGFLEQSNTDLAEEFVRLIIAQRAFQANTRTISTTNELLANLVVLGQ